jgi:hypothetical protein
MGYGQPSAASARYETLGATTGIGTNVTSGSTANSTGATVTLGTASFDYDGIYFTTQGGNTVNLLTVVINTGGSDQVIVPFVTIPHTTGGAQLQLTSGLIPVRVPAGAAVKVRMQATTASAGANVMLTGVQGNNNIALGFRGLACLTDITTGQPTTGVLMAGTTFSAWTQMTAATLYRIAGLYWSYEQRGTTVSSTNVLIQVGWGPAGSERILFTAGFNFALFPSMQGPYPCDLPAGIRLAVRLQASAANAQTISIFVHGLIA